MATPRIAAGALLRDSHGRILLVKPTYKDGWDIPGGYVEPGESPAAACARELIEEIGLRQRTGRLLIADWAPHPVEGDKLLFIFDGGTLDDLSRATADGQEISDVRFHRPEEIQGLMPERLWRRILTALSNLNGGDVYAEHGGHMRAEPG